MNIDNFLAICSGVGALGIIMTGCYWVIKKETIPLQLEIENLKIDGVERDIKEEKHFKLIMGKLDIIAKDISNIDKQKVSYEEFERSKDNCPARKMAFNKLEKS